LQRLVILALSFAVEAEKTRIVLTTLRTKFIIWLKNVNDAVTWKWIFPHLQIYVFFVLVYILGIQNVSFFQLGLDSIACCIENATIINFPNLVLPSTFVYCMYCFYYVSLSSIPSFRLFSFCFIYSIFKLLPF
jgi:hypothetical protein